MAPLQIRFEETKPLCSFRTDQLFDGFKLQLVVVVLRRDQFSKRLALRGLFDILTNRVDEQIRPIRIEEVGDRIESIDEILR